MPELIAILIALTQGILIGIVAWDMSLRKKTNLRLVEQEEKLISGTKALADLHNAAMKANEDLQNRIQSLELAMKSTTNVNVMKRF